MKFTIIFIIVLLNISLFASKTSSVQTGNWNTSSTWDNGVPGCFDTIVVSANHTVTLQRDEDLSSCSSSIYVIVFGTLNLNCSGNFLFSSGFNLSLPSGSAISIKTGGAVKGCNGGGILSNPPATITAGGNTIYDSDNDGTVSGPDYLGESGTTLPVILLSFTSEVDGNQIVLYWQTATEENSDYFQIERTIDGKNWYSIGVVQASGNSNTLLNYQFYDKKPNKGDNYYRLLQVDFNNKFEYFKPIYQWFNSTENNQELILYPNPNTEDYLSITLSGTKLVNGDIIELYDYSGRLLQSLEIQEQINKIKMNVSEYPKGIYFVRYLKRNKQFTKRLIIE